MSDDNALELSRRKALGALGTIGIAAAGAGAGTTAFLNDEETFTGNSVQAGTLNLSVDYTFTGHIGGSNVDRSGTIDGDLEDPASSVFSVSDVKPGDSAEIAFDVDLEGNPAYLFMFGNVTRDAEGDNPEPEPQPGSDKTGGEIDEKFDASISNDGTELVSGSLNEVFDSTASNQGLGVYGLPLDADNSGYDVSARAVGAALAQPADFVQPGVNGLTEFEELNGGGAKLNATVEAAEDDRETVAHAVSDGATNDYVTSVVDVGSVAIDASATYDYREGENNDKAAPDEVWLQVNDDNGDTRVVYSTFNDGTSSGDSSYSERDVGSEISGGGRWTEATSSGKVSIGSALTDDGAISTDDSQIERIGIGRGGTTNPRNLDVYYKNLTVDGTSYDIPTAHSEYTASGRDEFSTGTPTTEVTVDLDLPKVVGNEIQGDELDFEIGFYAVQARHNDGSPTA